MIENRNHQRDVGEDGNNSQQQSTSQSNCTDMLSWPHPSVISTYNITSQYQYRHRTIGQTGHLFCSIHRYFCLIDWRDQFIALLKLFTCILYSYVARLKSALREVWYRRGYFSKMKKNQKMNKMTLTVTAAAQHKTSQDKTARSSKISSFQCWNK